MIGLESLIVVRSREALIDKYSRKKKALPKGGACASAGITLREPPELPIVTPDGSLSQSNQAILPSQRFPHSIHRKNFITIKSDQNFN